MKYGDETINRLAYKTGFHVETVKQILELLESTDEQKALRADAETARSTCEWWEDCEMWESSCGVAYTFLSDGPDENEHEFCHKCGKRIAIDKARGL